MVRLASRSIRFQLAVSSAASPTGHPESFTSQACRRESAGSKLRHLFKIMWRSQFGNARRSNSQDKPMVLSHADTGSVALSESPTQSVLDFLPKAPTDFTPIPSGVHSAPLSKNSCGKRHNPFLGDPGHSRHFNTEMWSTCSCLHCRHVPTGRLKGLTRYPHHIRNPLRQ